MPGFLKRFLSVARSMTMRCCLQVVVVGALLAPLSVSYADAVFVYEGKDFKQDARIIIREGKVVLSDVDEKNLSLIYDTLGDIFRVLNHPKKTYLELSGEFVETLLDGMQALLPQLQTLAESPDTSDEQRELINELTSQASKGQSGGADSNEIKVSSIDSNRNILGLTCEEYAVSYQASAYDVCTIGYGKIGLSDEDKTSLRAVSDMLKRLASSVQFHEAQTFATVLGHLDGVILEAVDEEGESLMRLKQLTLASRSSSDGEIPKDYQQTDLFSIFSGL